MSFMQYVMLCGAGKPAALAKLIRSSIWNKSEVCLCTLLIHGETSWSLIIKLYLST